MIFKKKIRNVEWILSAKSEEEAEELFKQIENGEIPK